MSNDFNYDAYQYGNTQNKEPETEVNFIMQDPQPDPQPEPQVEPQYEAPKPKKKTWKKWVRCIAMAVVFGLVASAVFQVSNRVIDGYFGTSTSHKTAEATTIIKGDGESVVTDVTLVAKNVMPSVVSITNLTVQQVQYYFFGGTTTQEYESSGSGVIIGQNDTEILIATNNHVVEGSTTLTVTFHDETSVEAYIKGTDADIDIAVIAVPLSDVSNETMNAIKIATLGNSEQLQVGEPTIAIGNALGYGQSVTTGIVSALNRSLEENGVAYIQTDAAINPGNSGGALLNAKGEVIGINTAKLKDTAVEGMGYAIPISDIEELLGELMNRETRKQVDANKQGALGISSRVDVDENTSKLYGMPQGVFVNEIIEGGAAEAAGIPKGCIITKLDGVKISSLVELQELLTYYEAGETVTVTAAVAGEAGEYVETDFEVKLMSKSKLN